MKYQIENIVGVHNPEHHPQLKDIPLKIIGLPFEDGELCAQLQVLPQDFLRFSYSQRLEFIVGIPIAEEWLLKFGFEKIYESDRSIRFDIEIDGHHMITYEFWVSSGVSHLVYCGKNIQCDFVHELQNKIYALTNVELKISE